MTKYRYFGQGPAAYPDVVVPGEGSLYVQPGDVKELDSNPDPRWFIEVADPAPEVKATPVQPEPEAAPKSAAVNTNPDQVTVGE